MRDPRTELSPGDGLLIVDVQNDFCPGGALPIEGGDEVVPVLNAWIAAAAEKGLPVYASRDWHPLGHPSFEAEGGPWPEHCVQDTEGASFHPGLKLPANTVKVTKGVRFDHDQYSAFDENGLAERMKADGVSRLWIGGLALDVCVKASALEAVRSGFEVHLIEGASKPVSAEGGRAALEEMKAAGVVLE